MLVDQQISAKAKRLGTYALFRLAPLLALYVVVVLLASPASLKDDEPRYVSFATNLTHGYYSPPDHVDLWFGPGYPATLAPFVLFNLPWKAARLLNAVFLFGGVLYFYSTLKLYVSDKKALCFAFLMGVTPGYMALVHRLYSESLAIFLVCGFCYHFCKAVRDASTYNYRNVVGASLYLGWLALTKVIFGYILGASIVVLGLLWYLKKMPSRAFLVVALALLCCSPYLVYSYSISGKVFYWGTSGGTTIYWISSPFAGELGDWQGTPEEIRANVALDATHKTFFDQLRFRTPLEQDASLRSKGLQQILDHPLKFAGNWSANVGRLLFSYPFSFTNQKMSTYFYLFPNMFLVVFSILCVYPSIKRRKIIPVEITALMVLFLIAFGASSVVSAYERQFQILIPIVLIWMFYTLSNLVQITIE